MGTQVESRSEPATAMCGAAFGDFAVLVMEGVCRPKARLHLSEA